MVNFDGLFMDCSKMEEDYKMLTQSWNSTMQESFKKVRRSKKRVKGVDQHVKTLIQQEREVKKSCPDGQEKENKLIMLQEEISAHIAFNVERNLEVELSKIEQSKCPQAEVFKVRKNYNRKVSTDFPLKDIDGNIKVTRNEIDEVISAHFDKVFQQNPVTEGWELYWDYVNAVYDVISEREKSVVKDSPTFQEIEEIINGLDKSKSVRGEMTIELVKKMGVSGKKMIHRCVKMCFESLSIPEEFRVEKMVLLYKNKGSLDELDNYRGIFLRLIILTIYQKWLYSKSAPIANGVGSNTAFGGRKGKSGMEALLIIKLIQDHARWTKEQIVFKFLDVEKFFDSMNFRKCLIDLFNVGIGGSLWKAYETINKSKTCIPVIPSGPCSEIKINEIFVQGSSDAVLAAWNHMDSFNKKKKDVSSKNCTIQGIDFDSLMFIDDIAEVCKAQLDVLLISARLEVFQDETGLHFKPPKCKLLVMNEVEDIKDELGGIELMKVLLHEYLGTIVSSDGLRNDEIKSRIKKTLSVCNEIVQILKTTELSRIRLRHVKILSNACVDGKVKYGCAVWNKLSDGQVKELNALKVNMLKRVMDLPYSTPSTIIQYEFGVTDLELDTYMEKIILAYDMLNTEAESVGKRLLFNMIQNKVPGFCSELDEALDKMGLKADDELLKKSGAEIRCSLKKKIIVMQKERLVQKMMTESKADRILLNGFNFDGKIKLYLSELPFEEARVIFMLRSRMLPTKENFRGRWGNECKFCSSTESDMHLFSCGGYMDLLEGIKFDLFMTLDGTLEDLSVGAKQLLKVKERLEVFNTSESKQKALNQSEC